MIWDPIECTLSVYPDYVPIWPDDGSIKQAKTHQGL